MIVNGLAAADDAASVSAATPKDDPVKVHQAGRDFEALLIGQLLKLSHGSDSGWLGTSDDDASSSAMEYAQESVAQSMAASGGLGLAKLVSGGLENQSGK